jgi:hypothetical protein
MKNPDIVKLQLAKDSLPISFRIAFNTLIKNQILIEDDE